MTETFGTLLKYWRGHRHISQLELGLNANVSARHVSFLETGRANPSKSMVLQLSETLDIPRTDRNTLLNAAGFSPRYRARSLSEIDMTPIKAAIDWTLERHDPYPAFTLDRHWNILDTNTCATLLLGTFGIGAGDNLLDAFIDDGIFQSALQNWPTIAHQLIIRLQTESRHLGGDSILDAGIEKLRHRLPQSQQSLSQPLPAVIPFTFTTPLGDLSLFSTIAQFGSAEDIILADIKIELMFPADDKTRKILMSKK